jgi:hypothetical protein
MTGNDMRDGKLSSHERLEVAKGVPGKFRDAVKELRDEGVTAFIDKQLRRGYPPTRSETSACGLAFEKD